MQTAIKRPRLIEPGNISAGDARMARLLRQCGITELPPAQTRIVPLKQITIQTPTLIKPSAQFIRSIELIGIRQSPSVAFWGGASLDADDARYVVVMGRRRIMAAQCLLERGDVRFQAIKCEVYAWNAPRLSAFLALVENDQRSPSWIQEVMHLRQLISEGVTMTLNDLAEYGFNRQTIKSRLEMALLPSAICDQICSGTVSQDVARQITRLKESERERLDSLCRSGEILSAELVSSLLKRQINQGLTAVHLPSPLTWTEQEASPVTSSPKHSDVSHIPVESPPSVLLAFARQFEPYARMDPTLAHTLPLIEVLIKELEIHQRSSNHVPQALSEGEPTHV